MDYDWKHRFLAEQTNGWPENVYDGWTNWWHAKQTGSLLTSQWQEQPGQVMISRKLMSIWWGHCEHNSGSAHRLERRNSEDRATGSQSVHMVMDPMEATIWQRLRERQEMWVISKETGASAQSKPTRPQNIQTKAGCRTATLDTPYYSAHNSNYDTAKFVFTWEAMLKVSFSLFLFLHRIQFWNRGPTLFDGDWFNEKYVLLKVHLKCWIFF